MKKVLTAEQMREVDRLTTVEYGFPSSALMENAGKSVADAIVRKCGGSVNWKKILVLCGKGNNGGDGAVVSRILAGSGAIVTTLILGKVSDTAGSARNNFDMLAETEGVRVLELETVDAIAGFWSEPQIGLDKLDVVVDAVFGTGLSRPIEGIYRQFIESADAAVTLQDKPPLRVSVDIPSGVDADLATSIGYHFNADMTVTFTAPKMANVLPPICRVQGKLEIAHIGSPDKLIDTMDSQLYLAGGEDVSEWMSETAFIEGSYKKTRGSVLIVAGSKTYSGAAVLAGNAAMRSGAGLITIATPESAFSAVTERVLPEVMVRGVKDSAAGAFGSESYGDLDDLLATADAVGIGCGVTSETDEIRGFVRKVVETRTVPVVVDADGLNALSPFKVKSSNDVPLILTPHEGEFKRLTGKDADLRDRVAVLREFATKHGVICVLKGERTFIADPDGNVVVNPTGNPGLGKAGNGDNLAGLIAGFVAQTAAMTKDSGSSLEKRIFRAVVAAVYVAGLAGDIAAEKYGKHVMTASDVRDSMAEAFRTAGAKV